MEENFSYNFKEVETLSVKLRLMRLGANKQPFYRLVATDSRTSRNGKYLEELGYYNPIIDPIIIKLHEDRVVKWLNRGAVPTETVKSLLRKEGVLQRWNESRQGKPPVEAEGGVSSEELLQRELAQSGEVSTEPEPSVLQSDGTRPHESGRLRAPRRPRSKEDHHRDDSSAQGSHAEVSQPSDEVKDG